MPAAELSQCPVKEQQGTLLFNYLPFSINIVEAIKSGQNFILKLHSAVKTDLNTDHKNRLASPCY